jgi:hypothetical protein
MKEMPIDRLPGHFDASTDAFGIFGVRMGQNYPEEVWKVHLSRPIADGVGLFHHSMTPICRGRLRLIFGDAAGRMTDEMMILKVMNDDHIRGTNTEGQQESVINSLMGATGHLKTVFDILQPLYKYVDSTTAKTGNQWGGSVVKDITLGRWR